MAALVRSRIEDFLPCVPVIQGLRNPGMKSRHWEMLSERTQIKVMAKANLTFARCLELGLHNYVDDIATVAEIAGKEFTIEQVSKQESLVFIAYISWFCLKVADRFSLSLSNARLLRKWRWSGPMSSLM